MMVDTFRQLIVDTLFLGRVKGGGAAPSLSRLEQWGGRGGGQPLRRLRV